MKYKKIDELKYLFESPCFFLANYFSELRRQIDICAERLISAAVIVNTNQSDFNQIRNGMLQRIESFESNCLNSFKKQTRQRIAESADSIKKIESDFDLKCDKELIELIDDLIYKLNKILYLNYTYFFLDSNEPDQFGYLVIINEYLQPSTVCSLTERDIQRQHLNNSTFKSICLKKLIRNKQLTAAADCRIIEIDINSIYKQTNVNLFNEKLTAISRHTFSGMKQAIYLNLIANQINRIESDAFKSLDNLSVLNMSNNSAALLQSNGLVQASFNGLDSLERLHLDYINNRPENEQIQFNFENVFNQLTNLKELTMIGNKIKSIKLTGPTNCTCLILSGNNLNESSLEVNLPNLTELDLQSNEFVEFPVNTIKHFKNLNKLNLSKNLIESLNYSIESENLEELYLNGNRLSEFCFGLNNLTNLKHLDLSSNHIHTLHDFTFSGMISLKILNLSHNSLTVFNVSNLNESVEQLDLSRNEIVSFDFNSLNEEKKSNCLKWLNLENNLIENLAEYCFSSMSRLEHLELGLNKIKEIKNNTFQGLKNLQVLNLVSNEIEYIETNAFDEFRSLSLLNISNNLLAHSLTDNLFQELTQLEKLLLNSNKLTRINRNTFFIRSADDSNLKLLELNNNKLAVIEENAFDSLKNLVYLKMESNELTHLDSNLFYGMIRLRSVNVQHNHFVLDEQIELNGIDSKLVILCENLNI